MSRWLDGKVALVTGGGRGAGRGITLRRLVSNVEIAADDGEALVAAANAMVFGSHPRGDTVWASRNEFTLRRVVPGAGEEGTTAHCR